MFYLLLPCNIIAIIECNNINIIIVLLNTVKLDNIILYYVYVSSVSCMHDSSG